MLVMFIKINKRTKSKDVQDLPTYTHSHTKTYTHRTEDVSSRLFHNKHPHKENYFTS